MLANVKSKHFTLKFFSWKSIVAFKKTLVEIFRPYSVRRHVEKIAKERADRLVVYFVSEQEADMADGWVTAQLSYPNAPADDYLYQWSGVRKERLYFRTSNPEYLATPTPYVLRKIKNSLALSRTDIHISEIAVIDHDRDYTLIYDHTTWIQNKK